MATKTASTKADAKKSNPKPAAKPAKESPVKTKTKAAKAVKAATKDFLPMSFWNKVAEKEGKAKYQGTRDKFVGTLVQVLSANKYENPAGFHCRVLFKDGVRMNVAPTSLVKA